MNASKVGEVGHMRRSKGISTKMSVRPEQLCVCIISGVLSAGSIE